jgi:hypothetical protein
VPIAGSDFYTWVELTNSTNRHNSCCVRFLDPQVAAEPSITQPNSWFARTFNLGFSWRFGDRR